jgi:DNA polymerase III epsilon subunit family exonuclease
VRIVAWRWWWWRREATPTLADLGQQGFVALDVETTGLDPRRDAVVSLAAVPFVQGTPQPGYVTLVDPGRPIPGTSTGIHGITDSMVRGAPGIARVLPDVMSLCDGRVLVGHGVQFDLAVLRRAARTHALAGLRSAALDIRALAEALHPEWSDVRLEALAERFGITIAGRHSAEGDAIAAGRILVALLPALVDEGMKTVADLLWFQRAGRRRH